VVSLLAIETNHPGNCHLFFFYTGAE